MARRVYWVGLLIYVRKLCHYWVRYSGKMPTNLPASVATAMTALTIACTALEAFDEAERPGRPADGSVGGF